MSSKNHEFRPFEDAAKTEEQVHLADMHGDGVHFNREMLAKAKRNKQIAEEKRQQAQRKKNNRKSL